MNDLPVMDWRAGWRGERRSDGLEVKEPLIVVVVSSQLFTGTVTHSRSHHWSWLIVSSHFSQLFLDLRQSGVPDVLHCHLIFRIFYFTGYHIPLNCCNFNIPWYSTSPDTHNLFTSGLCYLNFTTIKQSFLTATLKWPR